MAPVTTARGEKGKREGEERDITTWIAKLKSLSSTHVSARMRALRSYRSSSSAAVRLFRDAFVRMALTPSGFGGRRMKDGRSPVAVDLRGRVGDGGMLSCGNGWRRARALLNEAGSRSALGDELWSGIGRVGGGSLYSGRRVVDRHVRTRAELSDPQSRPCLTLLAVAAVPVWLPHPFWAISPFGYCLHFGTCGRSSPD